MPLSPGTRPRRESGEPRIERDLSGQILELDVPEPYSQPRIMPSLVQFRNRSEMVSAATLVQKAKQFDDGLYAAVELAALHGCGDRAAKTAWLARLRRALGTDQAATSLYAAARMLDADADVPGPLKGTWALARETHAKQIDSPMAALLELPPEPARPELVVQPDLSCEPLVTHYRRRADSYRFVRAVVEDYFGTASLRSIHRQTADGAVDSSLDEELAFMTDLFDGAASTCEHELGASSAELGDDVFRQWNCSDDPDLGTDVRMMVPIFYDVQRAMTKVWVVLGWSERGLNVSFRQPPSITIRDDAGEDITARYDIKFGSRRYSIAYPEFAEVYVKRILHRDEFRALCDEHGTREKILAAL